MLFVGAVSVLRAKALRRFAGRGGADITGPRCLLLLAGDGAMVSVSFPDNSHIAEVDFSHVFGMAQACKTFQ